MSLAPRHARIPAGVRVGAPRAGSRAGAAVGGRAEAAAPADSPYAGLVTRTLAFAIDAAIVNGVAILTAAIVDLVFSIVSIAPELHAVAIAAAGSAYVLWTIAYFVTFWATTGQTPGDRALRIRVRAASGGGLRPRRALLRLGALMLAVLPLCLGLLPILLDDRRRGLHDMIARTVVVDARQADAAQADARG